MPLCLTQKGSNHLQITLDLWLRQFCTCWYVNDGSDSVCRDHHQDKLWINGGNYVIKWNTPNLNNATNQNNLDNKLITPFILVTDLTEARKRPAGNAAGIKIKYCPGGIISKSPILETDYRCVNWCSFNQSTYSVSFRRKTQYRSIILRIILIIRLRVKSAKSVKSRWIGTTTCNLRLLTTVHTGYSAIAYSVKSDVMSTLGWYQSSSTNYYWI